jgi:hypothetical protein
MTFSARRDILASIVLCLSERDVEVLWIPGFEGVSTVDLDDLLRRLKVRGPGAILSGEESFSFNSPDV